MTAGRVVEVGQPTDRPLERTLFCFALEDEARFFRPAGASVLLTGMGAENAARALRARLGRQPVACVMSCGFAGALNPDLPGASVLFDAAHAEGDWQQRLRAAGARPARFLTVDHMVITSDEKMRLWTETQADAVEMESAALRAVCREHRITCLTVRAVSDTACETLPLDFNALLTEDCRLHPGRLAWALLRSPGKIAGLWRLRQRTRAAARALAVVLTRLSEEAGTAGR